MEMERARVLLWKATQIGESSVFELAVVPVLKVLTMGALGCVLALPRFGVINSEGTKLLSMLVFAVFLPCLIFTDLGAEVTIQNVLHWWFIPANVVLSTAIGCCVGYLVALVCRPPRRFYRFVVAMTGVGNTGNVPLAIVTSICHSASNPFGPSCKSEGVAYVSLTTWITIIIVYTFVYHMLEAPEAEAEAEGAADEGEAEPGHSNEPSEASEDERDAAEPSSSGLLNAREGRRTSVLEADWPGLMDAQNYDEHQVPFLKRVWRRSSVSSLFSGVSEDGDFRDVSCIKEPKMVRVWRAMAKRTPFRHMFQPPVISSLLAICIGLFPRSKSVFFGDGAPLAFFSDSLGILAGAMVPCIMLVLGGTLSGGPGESELGLRTTIGICVARLLVLPVIGIGVLQAAEYLRFLPEGDPMFKFVNFMHYVMPTAILTGAMASLRGYGEKEAASLLFWEHLIAFFSVSLSIAVYINFLVFE